MSISSPAAPVKIVSLKTMLMRTVLLAALPIIAVSAGLIYHLVIVERAALRESILDSARVLGLAVDRELSNWQAIADTLARSDSLAKDDFRAFYDYAQRVAATLPGSRILLIAPDGRQIFNTARPFGTELPNLLSAPSPPPERGPIADALQDNRANWMESLRSGEPHFSNYFSGALLAQPSLAYRTPIKRDGRTLYVLAIAFPPTGLDALLRANAETSTKGWVGAIVDRRGVIAARSTDAERFVGQRATEDFLRAMVGRLEGLIYGKTKDGTEAITGFSRSLRSGWTVALAAPAGEAESSLRRSLGIWTAAVAGLVILGIWVARRTWQELGQPLGALARNAALFERGEAVTQPETRIREIRDCGQAWRLAIEADQARRAQERLRLAAEAREQQIELASREKDRVLAALGHELRNPLGAITNSVHVLGAAAPADPRLTAMIDIIKRQSQHLARLVDNLLDLARATFGKMQIERVPVDLLALAQQTVANYAPMRGAIASITIEGEPVWVRGDATRLGQVVRNLVDNAIKFTPTDGTIRIYVRGQDESAVLAILDSGAGIPPELIESLFGAFVQNEQSIERSHGGLGLGLALVRQIVQLHGGSVDAESAGAGTGTRVTVRLPRCAPQAPREAPRGGDTVEPARQRVLIVEDQADVRSSLRSLLELMGEDVRAVGDAARALELLEVWIPQVVLVDIGLPGMDGIALGKRIRSDSRFKNVRLIALTGYALPADRTRVERAGFDGFIAKPATRETLAEALARGARA